MPYHAGLRAHNDSLRKATDEEILTAYEQTGSVWKAGELLGMQGQTLHKRLQKLGANRPVRVWSDEEIAEVRALYEEGFVRGDGKLKALSERLRRTVPFISRRARAMGLTNQGRPMSPQLAKQQGEKISRRWSAHGHPRGMLGKKHSEETKARISVTSAERAAAYTPEEKSDIALKMLKTRVARYGTTANPRFKVSWKQGWREVGGKRCYFRSKWEANYARYLQWMKDQGKIAEWEHEPETFWFEAIKRGTWS